jgi:hypothetical protein
MDTQITRRQLLKSGGGVVLASFALPKSLRTLLDYAPASSADLRARAGSASNIEQVVVLMQENRSFDHYFGSMPGVRGFADPSVSKEIFYQPDSDNPNGYLLPFHIDTFDTSAQALPSNSHSWGPQHESWASGAMNGFVTSHLAADGIAGQYTMAYFERRDIPFHWAIADAFTVCDGYHCSMLGPTWPNRLFLMTGTVDPSGTAGGPVYANSVPDEGFSWTTYPEYLTQAGVSWKLYQEEDNYGMNVLEYFDQYQNASPSSPLFQSGMRIYEAGQFEYDAAHDQLPAVVLDHPHLISVRTPRFFAGRRGGLHRQQVGSDCLQPVTLGEDRFRSDLRRERRAVRPRPSTDRPAGHSGRVHHRGRHGRPNRSRLPGAVHRRVAVDSRWLREPRRVRSHVGDPADRVGQGQSRWRRSELRGRRSAHGDRPHRNATSGKLTGRSRLEGTLVRITRSLPS